jgi:hypothetical protein
MYSNKSRGLREPASRNPVELENRAMIFSSFYSNQIIRNLRSDHPRNWCPPWLWRFDHPRHFWLWLWLICLLRSTLTLPTTFSPAVYDLFRSTRHFWLWLCLWLICL